MGEGLAIVILGGFLGIALAAIATVLFVYGFVGRDARRGFIASAVSLGFAVVATLLSLPFWVVALSGRGTHGEAIHLSGDDSPIAVPVVVEAVALGLATIAFVRRWRERRRARG